MAKVIFLAVAAGLLSALPLYLAAAQPGGLLLLFLAPLPLFLSGLAQGVLGLAIAGATLLLLVLLLADFTSAASTFLILVGPTLLLVRQALLNRPVQVAAGAGGAEAAAAGPDREWYPSGRLAAWLSVIGLVWLAVLLFLLSGQEGGLAEALSANLTEAMTLYLPQAEESEIAQAVAMTSKIALGAGVVVWLLLLTLNGVLAQGALVRFGRNIRPSPDLVELRLPSWPAPALGIALALAFFGPGDLGFVAGNAALVLFVPFFFVGLAIVHAIARKTARNGTVMLVLFYALLVVFSWPALVVVLLGLFDQWADLRRRIAGSGQEDK